jgi:hypothetical protein
MLILLIACLVASPSTCREERISWSFEGTSQVACFAKSQHAIVRWQEEHPLWRVARWRCVSRRNVPVDL